MRTASAGSDSGFAEAALILSITPCVRERLPAVIFGKRGIPVELWVIPRVPEARRSKLPRRRARKIVFLLLITNF
jgi:hypothetical protein